jgi:hypothetical protein
VFVASAAAVVAAVGQALAVVGHAAIPAAKGAGLGLTTTAPMLGMFFLVQSRIDRRDPKLALAPVHADADLTFNEIPRGPLNQRGPDQ